jgi:hypothetical protein
MKKLLQGAVVLIMLLVTVVAASALTLGGSNQDASVYDENVFVYLDGSFSITTNVTDSMNCEVQPESDYVNSLSKVQKNINATLNGTGQSSITFNYVANESVSMPVRVQVPENLPAVDSDLNPGAFKVGTLVCTIDGNVVYSEDLMLQRRNELEITRINAEYGENYGSIRRSGDRITNIIPGDFMALEVQIRNNFPSRDNVDLDVDARLVCDRDIFVDRDQDDMILPSGERDSLYFDLEFEEDIVQAVTYDCILTMTSTDDYGARHGVEWDLLLEVHRENYELRVDQIQLNPNLITCTSREVSVNVFFTNIGSRNDRRAMIELTVPSLGITDSYSEIDMDSTDRMRRTFSFRVGENAKPGNHEVILKAYSRGTALTDTKIATLTVPDCSPPDPVVEQPEEPKEEPKEEPVVIVTPQPEVPVITEPVNETSDEEPAKERDFTALYITLLVIFIIVVIGGIVAMLIYLLKA